jgi:hypothetical protein
MSVPLTPMDEKGAMLPRRGRVTSSNSGTAESAGSLTREFEEPRIVALSTSSRICEPSSSGRAEEGP